MAKNGLLSTDFKVQPQEGPHKQEKRVVSEGREGRRNGDGAKGVRKIFRDGGRMGRERLTQDGNRDNSTREKEGEGKGRGEVS